MRFPRLAVLLAALAIASIGSSSARASSWLGFFSNSFTNGANWDSGVPGPTDPADFSANLVARRLVICDDDRTVRTFNVFAVPASGAYQFQQTGDSMMTVSDQLAISATNGFNSVAFDGFLVNTSVMAIFNNSALNLSNAAQVTASSFIEQSGSGRLELTSSTVNTPALTLLGTASVVANSGGGVTVGTLSTPGTAPRVTVNSGGTLTINNNSVVSAGTLIVNSGGTLNLGASRLTAQGPGRIQLNRSFVLPVGRTLEALAGGDIESTEFIDIGANGAGTLIISGLGSSIRASASVGPTSTTDWGNNGAATVSISNSATADYFEGLQIGLGGGRANVDITSGGTLNAARFLVAGGSGPVNINVSGGGLSVTSAGTAEFRSNVTTTLQASGSLEFEGNATFLSGSTLNWISGSLNIDPGRVLTVDGGTVNNTSGGQQLGNAVTLRVTRSGTTGGQFINNSFFDIARTNATGTLLVDGAGSRFTAAGVTDWGRNPGSSATVTFSNSGVGTFSTGLRMSDSGGRSLLNLNSGGQLNMSSFLAGGGTGSSATINIAGGTFNSLGAASFRSGSVVNLTNSSGGLALGGDATFSSGATLNWTDGFIFASERTLAFVGGVASVSIGRVLPGGMTLRITNGGRFESSSFFDIANFSNTGTLLVDGAGSRISTGSLSVSDWGALPIDAATITFSTSGVGTYGGLKISAGGGRTLVNLTSGGRLNAATLSAGGGSTSVATINVDGGVLNSIGDASLRNGTVVNYSAGSIGIGGALDMESNAQLLHSAGGDKVLRVGGLSMSGTSKIDLADNDMIVDYTGASPIATVRGHIASAHANGAWTGSGITTSTGNGSQFGLGYAEASALFSSFPATFAGQQVDDTSVLVGFTRYGDANLDGSVNLADFNRLAANFGSTGAFWHQGDFTYDGAVNLADFNRLAANFGLSAAGPNVTTEDWAALAAAVPEPGTLGLLLPLFGAVSGRRRRPVK